MKVSDVDRELRQKLVEQIEEIQKRLPDPLPVAEGHSRWRLSADSRRTGGRATARQGDRFDYGVQCCFLPEAGKRFEVPPVYFGANGMDVAEDQKSFVVEPGYLRVLAENSSLPTARRSRQRDPDEWPSPGTGQVDCLARQSLTARVMVNRNMALALRSRHCLDTWQFRQDGMLPSHPELLDWLATEFVRQKWSLKQMHRLVMTSETYKMASTFAPPVKSGEGSQQRRSVAFPTPPPRGRSHPRHHPLSKRPAQLEAGGPPFFPSIPKALARELSRRQMELTKNSPPTGAAASILTGKRGLKIQCSRFTTQPDPT